jgi:dienelactone hydrolase
MSTADGSSAYTPFRLRTLGATALAGSFLLLAGCGGGGGKADDGATSPAAEVQTFGCLTPEEAKTGYLAIHSPDGQDVEAFATGKGSTALILAHQADGTVCQWVPEARDLAEDGYRVVAVDSAGSDVEELTLAVGYARRHGATKVLLVGASKGGTAVLTAAGSITPKVDAVVSLSAPDAYGAMDAISTVPDLTMPIFYMASEGDTDFAASTKELSKASRKSAENVLHIVVGPNHGVSMLGDLDDLAMVKAFLKKYGG